jgi:hypothetical protein
MLLTSLYLLNALNPLILLKKLTVLTVLTVLTSPVLSIYQAPLSLESQLILSTR